VDGDNWYLNYCSDNPYFEEYYDKNIDKAWINSDYVDCCIDEEYIKKYIQESLKIGIEFRVLLCSTCKNSPQIEKIGIENQSHTLGFDYAYSGGSYYSCVLNDIISKRIKEFGQIKLNENGLFNTYKEAEEFSLFRNHLKSIYKDYNFEEGDFVIYKIIEMHI
jgi:hypothetical protein